MKMIRTGSYRQTYAWPIVFGVVLLFMAAAPKASWGQSSWPSYPNNSTITVTSAGNVGIGTTSPAAALHAVTPNTSTTAFRITAPASMGADLFDVYDNGSNVAGVDRYGSMFANRLNISSGLTFMGKVIYGNGGGVTGNIIQFDCWAGGCYANPTSGTVTAVADVIGFNPTSGTATFASMQLSPTINQTGGATGVARGLYINPTLTAASSWRSIETSNNSGYAIYTAGTASSFFGGSVGIGTASPGYKLDVQGGQINSSGGYCINGSCITSWPTGGGTVTSVAAGAGLSGGTITTSGTFSLNLGNANSWTGAQTFGANTNFPGGVWSASGFVGIGTTSPSKTLTVNGDINFTGNLYQNGALFSGGSSQWTTSSSNIYYSSGNVGIGTTTPAAPLDVEGGLYNSGGNGDVDQNGVVNLQDFLLLSSYLAGSATLTPSQYAAADVAGTGLVTNIDASAVNLISTGAMTLAQARSWAKLAAAQNPYLDGNSNLGIGVTRGVGMATNGQLKSTLVVQGSDDTSGTSSVTVMNSDGTVAMKILNNGAVGIGMTAPVHPLQVNGTIGAQEVIVSSNGADYVFQPDYRLESLSEVKTFIQENHHLPDIPSAEEVKEKGLSLGDMQAKLLAKVEELTLHMIEADERNKALEKKNTELQQRVARLEAASGDAGKR